MAITIPAILLQGEEEPRTKADININGVMFDPLGGHSGKKWVEIFNPSHKSQSMSGWTVINRAGEVTVNLPGWSLPAGTYPTVDLRMGEDDHDLSLAIDPPETNHTFSFDIELHEGENPIVIWVKDEMGSCTESEVTVFYLPYLYSGAVWTHLPTMS